MTRLDQLLLALGPAAILLLWLLLPSPLSEGAPLHGAAQDSAVVAELVGYAVEAEEGGPARLVGRGVDAGVRLHQAPVARHAAYLFPPAAGSPAWSIVPAGPGPTLELVAEEGAGRVRTSSQRPWKDDTGPFADPRPIEIGCRGQDASATPVRLREVRVRGANGNAFSEPEILWLEKGRTAAVTSTRGLDVVSCGDGTVWWKDTNAAGGAPCDGPPQGFARAGGCGLGSSAVCAERWSRSWGVRLRWNGEERLITSWSDGFDSGGLWLDLRRPEISSARLGVDAALADPACAGCPRPPLPLCTPGNPEPVATLGALELVDGDLLAIGSTRFLVKTGVRGSRRRLELYHVRDPKAPGFFRTSAGHDVYHPNRRALWSVPPCGDGDGLNLVILPRQDGEGELGAAELPLRDGARWRQMREAERHAGVSQELPAVTPERQERSLLSVCAESGDGGEIDLRLAVDAPGGLLLAEGAGEPAWLGKGERRLALGSASDPREALLGLGGNLLRLAPASGVRVARRARLGLAGYLSAVCLLQGLALGWARRRAPASGGLAPRTPWPAELGPPTLQQLAGTGILCLLFLGASFQLLLGLHPQLAGKPDYAQAFFLGIVVVSAVLVAAAGFAAAPRGAKTAGAALGASLSLFTAALWWWLDGFGRPGDAWLTALRDPASAASGAGPAALGAHLAAAGAAGLGAALVLRLAGRLPVRRMAEKATRLAVSFPACGLLAAAALGLGLGIAQGSALAFELALLAGLAFYAASYWSFVRRGRPLFDTGVRHRTAFLTLLTGWLGVGFLAAFFLIGSELPDGWSFFLVVLGATSLSLGLRLALREGFSSLLRVLCAWLAACAVGSIFASAALRDMGSVAAWVPAAAAGFFLWLVRPEESEGRLEEPRKAVSHLYLTLGSGLVLLGLLDVFKLVVGGLDWSVLDRPRQRLALAEDVSYITAGEWITQVRWLASLSPQGDGEGALRWVPNVNSDVAIFGLAAGFGILHAILASVLVLGVAGCAGLAADQALREARAMAATPSGGPEGRSGYDRVRPALCRALGLFLGMVGVLLVAQWLVHLATGVVLHLPITGLVFPWISHGNTTHLLYAAALLLPMAAATALGDAGRGAVPPRAG